MFSLASNWDLKLSLTSFIAVCSFEAFDIRVMDDEFDCDDVDTICPLS